MRLQRRHDADVQHVALVGQVRLITQSDDHHVAGGDGALDHPTARIVERL